MSDERLILRETQRAVTPYGGIAVFISFLGKIGLVGKVRARRLAHASLPGSGPLARAKGRHRFGHKSETAAESPKASPAEIQ